VKPSSTPGPKRVFRSRLPAKSFRKKNRESSRWPPGKIHIGTSGWHYRHWVGVFYPEDLRSGDFLDYYREKFRTVEINNSFYRLPAEETMKAWRSQVPGDFLFAIKASRYLTHMKKLKEARQPLGAFLDRAALLGDKLGPVLFQLPPRWHCNIERLREFLSLLPERYSYASNSGTRAGSPLRSTRPSVRPAPPSASLNWPAYFPRKR